MPAVEKMNGRSQKLTHVHVHVPLPKSAAQKRKLICRFVSLGRFVLFVGKVLPRRT